MSGYPRSLTPRAFDIAIVAGLAALALGDEDHELVAFPARPPAVRAEHKAFAAAPRAR